MKICTGKNTTLKVDKDKKLPYCAQVYEKVFIYKNTFRICRIIKWYLETRMPCNIRVLQIVIFLIDFASGL